MVSGTRWATPCVASLSSMEGVAPTEVSIEGRAHGTRRSTAFARDVVDILLNLKGVVLKMHNRREATVPRQERRGVVTAADIVVDP